MKRKCPYDYTCPPCPCQGYPPHYPPCQGYPPHYPPYQGYPPHPPPYYPEPPPYSPPYYPEPPPYPFNPPPRNDYSPPRYFDVSISSNRRDLNEHYATIGERPQNFILCPTPEQMRQSNPSRDLMIRAKEELVRKTAAKPTVIAYDGDTLRGSSITKAVGPEARYDVVYVLPPPPGWTAEDVSRLGLGAVAESPSFLFLWSGSSCEEVERGRALLRGWGFRRAEDICWIKTNKGGSAKLPERKEMGSDGSEKDSSEKKKRGDALEGTSPPGEFLVRTVEHCLVGIKGTVVRASDTHIVDANVDTDVIVSEERPTEEMYRRIEHFCIRQRRLVLFEAGEGRPGWITVKCTTTRKQ